MQLQRDIGDNSYEALGFKTNDAATIDAEIESLKARIDPPVLRQFEKIATKYDRPLVPIHNGVCYGCFVRYPTAKLADIGDTPTTCESCGRLIYQVP
jgi:predicted  nucleic acid-binding Zn-ribbon protein